MNCNCVYEYDSKFYSRNDMYLFLYPKEGKYKLYEDEKCKKEITINEFLDKNSTKTKIHMVIKD
jgi:hypothetical protein